MQSELKDLVTSFKSYLEEEFARGDFVFGDLPDLSSIIPQKATRPKPRPLPLPVEMPPPSPLTKAVQKETPEPIALEVLAPRPIPSNSPWEKLLLKIDPSLKLYQEPLSDRLAQKIKNSWKEKSLAPEIALFVSRDLIKHKLFLKNLCQAIALSKAPCRLVPVEPLEKESKWENFLAAKQLRLILCPDELLFALPGLLAHYKEIPQKHLRTLGTIPLLLLPNLSLYARDPLLKRSLWNVICQSLAT